jgi:ABC-2 type transport system permease protein
MDQPSATTAIRYSRFLPYWAVLQTDLRQTARSWVYRMWVLLLVVAAGGYVLFKLGAAKKAGEFQPASVQTGDLLRALVIGSLSLVSLIAVSSIGGERGSIADSILSRGISRHQYFLAKWHARLGVTVGTFVALAATVLATYAVVFTESLTGGGTNLTLLGGLLGVLVLAAGLAVVVSWGVTIGALSNGTVTGITLFWVVLFGGLLVLSQLPNTYPTPERMLDELKRILAGTADITVVKEFVLVSLGLSFAAAMVGLIGFSRRDV